MGSSQSRSVCMGLDYAIYNWYAGYCSEGHGGCFVELYSEYFTSKLDTLLVMDNSIMHKALQALESIDTFGIFKGVLSANICAHILVHIEYFLSRVHNSNISVQCNWIDWIRACIHVYRPHFFVFCMLHTTYIALFYVIFYVSLYLIQNDFFGYYDIFALGNWCHGHQHWQHWLVLCFCRCIILRWPMIGFITSASTEWRLECRCSPWATKRPTWSFCLSIAQRPCCWTCCTCCTTSCAWCYWNRGGHVLLTSTIYCSIHFWSCVIWVLCILYQMFLYYSSF